jgi:hypothetical protein
MAQTPEQRRASQELQFAIEKAVDAYKPKGSPAEMVADWAVVACGVRFDDDGNRICSYSLCFPGGETDAHRGVGLFAVGQHLVRDTGSWSSDDT